MTIEVFLFVTSKKRASHAWGRRHKRALTLCLAVRGVGVKVRFVRDNWKLFEFRVQLIR